VSAALSTIPAASVIIMYFPVLRRFTYTSAVIFRRQLQQFQKSFAKHPFNFSTHFPHLVLNYHPVPHADKVFA
jgi:hypothetical protein